MVDILGKNVWITPPNTNGAGSAPRLKVDFHNSAHAHLTI